MVSLVERTRQFLWMTILGPEPQAPFCGRSYESCINQEKLSTGQISYEEWCKREGINITLINSPKQLVRLPKQRKRKSPKETKVVTLHRRKIKNVAAPIQSQESKDEPPVQGRFKDKWLQKITSLRETDFTSAKSLTVERLVYLRDNLGSLSDKPVSFSDFGLSPTDALLMHAIDCADRKTFEYSDPDIELAEGDLKILVDKSIKYLETFPQAQNVSKLFRAIWEKRGVKSA